MTGRIAASLSAHLERYAGAIPVEVTAAASDLHHIVMGPGPALETEWLAAGLDLPDLGALRRHRLDRTVEQIRRAGIAGVFLHDPMNLRYVTDSTNMQLWVMHNAARAAWVGADGRVVLWDYTGCEFLGAHNDLISEIRPSISADCFASGDRADERAAVLAGQVAELAGTDGISGPIVALDRASVPEFQAFERAGLRLANAQPLMEEARRIKGPDEIRAMRCAVHACEATMADMQAALRPGMTEREIWAHLHAGNIARAGEWIETQILSSGPRTNPWFQEASARTVEDGDLLAYDTDLVGAYGMMVDISRTWVVGDAPPAPAALHAYDLAIEQMARNEEILRPGISYRELAHRAWFPDPEHYRHYSCLYHGVGQCDEVPCIPFPAAWDEAGYDGVVEPGMVMTVESFVGARSGGEGVKLENQYLITDDGIELLTGSSLALR